MTPEEERLWQSIGALRAHICTLEEDMAVLEDRGRPRAASWRGVAVVVVLVWFGWWLYGKSLGTEPEKPRKRIQPL